MSRHIPPCRARKSFRPALEPLEDRWVPTVAYDVLAGTAGNQTIGGVLGMDFNVHQPVVVTRLGVFDSGADGLSVPITARLFNRATQTEVARIDFPAGTPGTLVGGSRLLPLATPLSLPAGFQGTIVAEGYGAAEPVGDQGIAPLPISTNSGGGQVSFVGGGRFGSAGTIPASPANGPANRYAAGTFQFHPDIPNTVAVPNLFATGVDASGAPLPTGSVDPHYQLTVSADPAFPGPNAFVTDLGVPPIPWIPNGTTSQWLAPRIDSKGFNAVGVYSYRTTFDLTGFDPATVRLFGQWSTDNEGLDILLNGASTGITSLGPGEFTKFTPFTLTTGFVAGVNTLDFVLENSGLPTALRVDLEAVASSSPTADLAVTKTNGTGTVTAGDNVTYTVVVTNNGPDDIAGAEVTDTFPPGLTNVTWTATASAGSRVAAAAGSGHISTTVDLFNGGSVTFTVQGTVTPAATGTLSNTAIVTPPAGVLDSDLTNNSATDDDTVAPPPLVKVSPIIVVGADAGTNGLVRVFDAATRTLKFQLSPFPGFPDGVRVATGDVTGDGTADIVAGTSLGRRAWVRVFDGVTGQPLAGPLGFFSVGSTRPSQGGVFVAAADVTADGLAEVIVGYGRNETRVAIYDGRTGQLLRHFRPFAKGVKGAVAVTAADLNGDGRADVIASLTPGGRGSVRGFDGRSLLTGHRTLLVTLTPPGVARFGAFVTALDINADGRAEVVTSSVDRRGGLLTTFDGLSGQRRNVLRPLSSGRGSRDRLLRVGRVVLADGTPAIVIGAFPQRTVVALFDARSLAPLGTLPEPLLGGLGRTFINAT